jgi:ATP-dependent DNA helicase RecG
MSLLKKSVPTSPKPTPELSPQSTIDRIVRITAPQKAALARLGIITARDLLYWAPTRYTDIARNTSVLDAAVDETVTVAGKVLSSGVRKGWKTKVPMGEAVIEDTSGRLSLVWFHQAFLAKTLQPGQTIQVTGVIKEKSGKRSMINPEIENRDALPIDSSDSLFGSGEASYNYGFPIYRESRGITSRFLYHAIRRLLSANVHGMIPEPLPDSVRTKYNLPSLADALVALHSPRSEGEAVAAKKRIAFDEMFLIQLHRQKTRSEYRSHTAYALSPDKKSVTDFKKHFSFPLTGAQERTLESILHDMSESHPMTRLLEGDVGSGKTAVAAVASFAGVTTRPVAGKDFGTCQVAYMAPTEILATQLFESFIQYFKTYPIRIALMTGAGCRVFPSKSNPNTWTTISRPQLLKWVANGEIAIVIGTHSLIQKSVVFKHLALAIVDEQHRFGTKQRAALAAKDGFAPHFLSMSATPIPRTLALTIWGDLDLSVLDELPPGRKQVITNIVNEGQRATCESEVAEALRAGRQLYVICPRIDLPAQAGEPDYNPLALETRSVTSEAKRLSSGPLKQFRVGVLHSKMTKDAKEKTMMAFANHDLDVLVATSVVEVGVNVPNATHIIIEGAERFGLAQLHQLRGRVQRGSFQPYCYLVSNTSADTSLARLKALANSSNGFELAEQDLSLRGAGMLAGGKQWGMSDIAMEALRNPRLVEAARSEAKAILGSDPSLVKYPNLKTLIQDLDAHHE